MQLLLNPIFTAHLYLLTILIVCVAVILSCDIQGYFTIILPGVNPLGLQPPFGPTQTYPPSFIATQKGGATTPWKTAPLVKVKTNGDGKHAFFCKGYPLQVHIYPLAKQIPVLYTLSYILLLVSLNYVALENSEKLITVLNTI